MTRPSSDSGLEGASPGEGGGAGGVIPGIRNSGTGGVACDEGMRREAFLRHNEANSNEGTGTAYDWLSQLKIKMKYCLLDMTF